MSAVRSAATRMTALSRRNGYPDDHPRVVAARHAYAEAKIRQAIERSRARGGLPLPADARARLDALMAGEMSGAA